MLTQTSLTIAVLFLVLWRLTPAHLRYETVEGDIVSTRAVFLLIALISLGFFVWSLFP